MLSWLAPLALLLLATVTGRSAPPATPTNSDRRRAIASFGLATMMASLLPFLLQQISWVQQALPQALTGKAVAMAQLCLLLTLLLTCGALRLVVDGIGLWRGLAMSPTKHAAQACSLFEFWQRLLPAMMQPGRANFIQAMPAMALIAAAAALWKGSLISSAVWITLQCLALSLEQALQRRSRHNVHPFLRWLLTMLWLGLCSLLWIAPDTQTAWNTLGLLATETPINNFNLLLNKRLTLQVHQIQLIAALILAASQGPLQRILILGATPKGHTCLWLGSLCMLIASRDLLPWPAAVKQAIQQPLCSWLEHGNSAVHQGYEGWLFDQREWDRRTLRRQEPGLLEGCIELSKQLKAKGAELVIVAAPAKLAMVPEMALRAQYPGPVQPPDWAQTLERLEQAKVRLLDPAPALWNRIEFEPSHYASASHWTFESMKAVASALARDLRARRPDLVSQETPAIQASIAEHNGPGDLASLLLPLSPLACFDAEQEEVLTIDGLPDDPAAAIAVASGALGQWFGSQQPLFDSAPAATAGSGDFATQVSALVGKPVHRLEALPINALAQRLGKSRLLILLLPADEL